MTEIESPSVKEEEKIAEIPSPKKRKTRTRKKRKKQVEQPPKPEQNFKLLISIPATQSSHLPFQPQVLEAIKKAAEGYVYDLDVGEPNEAGWQFVVDQYNRVVEKVISEKYDYVLIIESDVVIPPNALLHLLTVGTDVATAVIPWHTYPDDPALAALYKDMVGVGWFLESDKNIYKKLYRSSTLHMQDVKDKILTFKDGPLLTSAGCILIKRSVFEKGIRFIYNFKYASYDVIFWRDIAEAGFTGASDGFVVCEHLGT